MWKHITFYCDNIFMDTCIGFPSGSVEVRNRFKRLDLIDRVPDELWMEVRDIVQETGIKTTPTENKCNKAKWLFEEALQLCIYVAKSQPHISFTVA